MGGGSAEGYYAGSLYTGIGLAVIAVLNMILYLVAVRHSPTTPTHDSPHCHVLCSPCTASSPRFR